MTGKTKMLNAGIIFISALFLLTCSHPLVNPVDPEADNYIGVESEDLDGDGVGSLYDVDDISLISPSDGETVATLTPTLTVFPFDTDTVNQYRIQISLYEEEFDGFIILDRDDCESNSCIVPADTLYDSTFFWRAKAWDGTNWSEAWTGIRSFTVDTGNPLTLSPADGVSTADTTPLLDWADVPGAAGYRVQINTDTLFGNDTMLTDDDTLTVSQFQVSALLETDSPYFWRTCPVNAEDVWGGWSDVYYFTVAILPPSEPSPENLGTVKGVCPALDWEDISGASMYHLQLGSNSTFSTILEEDDTLTTSEYTVQNALTYGTSYYWRVKTCNDDDQWGEWSDAWRFTPALPAFTKHILIESYDSPLSVFARDIDGDGNMDVLSCASNDDKITWWKNGGSGSFTEYTITDTFNSVHSVYAEDLDGDGDIDIQASNSSAGITWWENDGSENFTAYIITSTFSGCDSIHVADVDGDGHMDVLGASYDYDAIAWFENDGNENFTQHTVVTSFDYACDVYAEDIDGDGDMDILGVAYSGDSIRWWENDGNENFTSHSLSTSFNAANSVSAADIDQDGDIDILGTAYYDGIAWWENDGSENFTMHTVTASVSGVEDACAADIDRDGDMDILGSATYDDEIIWFENNGGSFTAHTITESLDGARAVYSEDLDGDGDMDVLGTAYYGDQVAWLENDLIP